MIGLFFSDQLDDITLTRVTTAELLPPFPEIAAQLREIKELLVTAERLDPANGSTRGGRRRSAATAS